MSQLQSLCCTTAKAQVAVTSKVRVCASARRAWREHVSPAWSVRLQTPRTRTGSASAHPSHAPHRNVVGDSGWSLVHKSDHVAARRLYKGRLRNDIQMALLSSSRTQNRKSIRHDNSYAYRHRHPHLTSHTFPPSRRVVVVVVRPPSRRAVVVDGMRSGGRSGNVNRNQKRSFNAWPNRNRPEHIVV